MKNKIILIFLSVIFTISLVFASLELPLLLDNQIQDSVGFLQFDHQLNELNINKTNLYIEHYHLKEIGYISLSLIVLLIFLGFYYGKKSISLLGAFAVFIPVFGHFAFSMFFLAGLGFLRVIWIPLTEVSPYFMSYGDIIYLPNNIILSIGKIFDIYLSKEIAIFFILIGGLLFTMGVYTWFSTKFLKANVAKSFIYKISRHPQYLGWILWSYGLFLLPRATESFKITWGYPDSLPWLLATMIIIAVSLFEEISMQNRYGDEYADFKRKTSFMFPLPKWLISFIKHPLNIFFNTTEFSKKRHVLVFISYYTLVFVLISFMMLAFTEPQIDNPLLRDKKKEKIAQYFRLLENGTSRRQKDIAAMKLARYGKLSVPYLLKSIKSKDEITKSFSIWALRKINDTSVCEHIVSACNDSSLLVLEEAILAIGKMNCSNSKDILLKYINHPKQRIRDVSAYAIGRTQLTEAVPLLLMQFEGLGKYSKITYIEALGNIGSEEALELLHDQLKSNDQQIIEASIIALSKIGNETSIIYLKELISSDNWELSLYTKEAIKIIEKKK